MTRRLRRAASRRFRSTVLIVSGPAGEARRYRGNHRAEQLERAGVPTRVCHRVDVDLARAADRFACIVLYRVGWDDGVGRLFEVAPQSGCAVVCDFDDLVFDPGAATWLRALDALDAEAREAYIRGMAAQRATLAASGRATVATEPLVAPVSALASSVDVVHNVVSETMVRQAAAVTPPDPGESTLRVGYLSGTPTHDRDFLEAADAVLEVLEGDGRVRLVVAGFLELDERFRSHESRIERFPYQPWQRLPTLLASLDVNLAPLERGNPFTECKSCLKYLEAALVAVPTVASRRADFARVIDDGSNGLLADSPEDWLAALTRVLDDAPLRRELGRRARADVLTNHTTSASAAAAARALRRLVPDLDELGRQ